MDGYEVARQARNMPGLEKTVLAALTGWGPEEDRRRTAEAGFDHHLVKPPRFQLTKLCDRTTHRASMSGMRDGGQDLPHFYEVSRLHQVVIEAGLERILTVRFLPVARHGDQNDTA
jgi:CheY-like chemotaxis protein